MPEYNPNIQRDENTAIDRQKVSRVGQHHSNEPKTSGLSDTTKVLLVVFLVLAVGSVIYGQLAPRSVSTSMSDARTNELVGRVRFDGADFTITNSEAVNWTNCWATLNTTYFYPSGAPSSRFDGVEAGETIAITPSQFTDGDGVRFNVGAIRPQDVAIECDGRFGYWAW